MRTKHYLTGLTLSFMMVGMAWAQVNPTATPQVEESTEQASETILTDQIRPVQSQDKAQSRSVDQIGQRNADPSFSVDQAEGGVDRCDPAYEGAADCEKFSEGEAISARKRNQRNPEVDFVTTVEQNSGPSFIDPVDAANRIGRGDTNGSQVAASLGLDLITNDPPDDNEDEQLLLDDLGDLPPDFLQDIQGLPSTVVTRGD